jgi:hypothetical protein
VSAATPMAIGKRLAGYAEQTGRFGTTPAQHRRHRRKYGRKYGQALYGSSGKHEATPRRKRRAAQ